MHQQADSISDKTLTAVGRIISVCIYRNIRLRISHIRAVVFLHPLLHFGLCDLVDGNAGHRSVPSKGAKRGQRRIVIASAMVSEQQILIASPIFR